MLTTQEESDFLSILDDAEEALDNLRRWDRDFVADLRARYETEGAAIVITGRMWVQLRRIEEFVNAL